MWFGITDKIYFMSPMEKDNQEWLEKARAQGAKYLLNVCDTWDYDNYPVFLDTDDELTAARKTYSQNMQRIDAILDVKTGKTIN